MKDMPFRILKDDRALTFLQMRMLIYTFNPDKVFSCHPPKVLKMLLELLWPNPYRITGRMEEFLEKRI